jgi:hypothetical protein
MASGGVSRWSARERPYDDGRFTVAPGDPSLRLPKLLTLSAGEGSLSETQTGANGKGNVTRGRAYSCDWPPAKRATIKDPSMIAP